MGKSFYIWSVERREYITTLKRNAMLITSKVLFFCNECNKLLLVTAYGGGVGYPPPKASLPQTCPKCGSIHTLPLKGLLCKHKYRMM